MVPKKRVPSGYGSVSSVAGPTGNPLFTRHQIISGHAARDSAASPKKTPARTSPQRLNARTFPLYTPRLFAAMPIRSYLGGQRFDPATIPRVGDGPSFLRLVVN